MIPPATEDQDEDQDAYKMDTFGSRETRDRQAQSFQALEAHTLDKRKTNNINVEDVDYIEYQEPVR